MEDLRIIRSKDSPLDSEMIAIEAMRRSKLLQAEDDQIEREKMRRYEAMKSDPLWDLKLTIAEKEKELEALKENLYQRSTELSMQKFEQAGIRFVESSSGARIKFLGR